MGSEENEDRIRKALHENPDGLSFNRLKEATDMSTQSFINATNNLKDKEELSSWKDGYKTMFSLSFCDFCHNEFKKSAANLFNQENSWQNLKTKTQRSTSFIHFLHQISSNFLSLLMMYVFEDHQSVYRVCLKQLEEELDEQKKIIRKTFSKNEQLRMFEEILNIQSYEETRSEMIRDNAQKRKVKRTLDEIVRDLEDYIFYPSSSYETPTIKLKRTNLIKNPKARKKYQYLEKKYLDLKRQMGKTRDELKQIS